MATARKRRAPAAREAAAKAEHHDRKPHALQEKFVVFLRHGIAEDRTDEKPDAERTLTYEGHARMKEIGRGLEDLFPKADALLSSPLVRATQTALWVAKAYRGALHPEIAESLLPESSPERLIDFVRSVDAVRPILVGHEPLLSMTVAALVGIAPEALDLKKGGCLGVRIAPTGAPVLEWALPPRVLRRVKA
ncbi:MAG TPA: histidine phosphatase family protein [Thermoanaerobaculia bacterium]